VPSAVRAAQLRLWAQQCLIDHRRGFVVLLHLALIVSCNYVAYWLRFDGAIPDNEWQRLVQTLPWLIAIRALTFLPFRLYSGLWQYTGIMDACNIAMAVLASTTLFTTWLSLTRTTGYSRSVLIMDSVLLILTVTGVRVAKRLVRRFGRKPGSTRVLILGAGDAGEMIVRDMQKREGEGGFEPIGFVDDDPAKAGQRIHAVPVLGNRGALARIVADTNPHEVLVAMPSASPKVMQEIVASLQPFKITIKTLPSVRDILDGRVALHQIRELTVEDLLPRAPVDLSSAPLRQLIEGRRVMVTGAGGSIGSELSRQIAKLAPASLVLYERYENSLYTITNDLAAGVAAQWVHPTIGDVTDVQRLRQVMERYQPELVFHAAAHKHVPMMEHNPCEAVKNNVFGTAMLAQAAERVAVERLIMISTDKAVNPTSVMGATKRIGELILQAMSATSSTRLAVVRFGNVLGSNGSVIPRFLEQIKAGGPVTVTHPDIRRFFMLIPEAVQLVLHAAVLGEPGAVYVLEMGEQIKLVDLARTMIRCAGFIPDQDVPIAFVGLRPGEKLYEELVGNGESAEPSRVPKILRVRPDRIPDRGELDAQVSELIRCALGGDEPEVIDHLRSIVPTFEPSSLPGTPAAVPRLRRVTTRQVAVRRSRSRRDATLGAIASIADGTVGTPRLRTARDS
jgi:FlaA1/EpsC-like NDP-sugar epimerase